MTAEDQQLQQKLSDIERARRLLRKRRGFSKLSEVEQDLINGVSIKGEIDINEE